MFIKKTVNGKSNYNNRYVVPDLDLKNSRILNILVDEINQILIYSKNINNMDLISVIIPYYRKREYIRDTLNSVLRQTYKNLEVIIIYDDQEKKFNIY